jgi:hypothetical protein
LDLSGSRGCESNDAGSGGNAGRSDGNQIGRIEIGVVEEIEKLGAKLQTEFFADTRVF